jgi:hypothetical protein
MSRRLQCSRRLFDSKKLAYFALSTATSDVSDRPVRFKTYPCNRVSKNQQNDF